MYGTIAQLRLKPGAENKFLQLMRDFEALKVPGYAFEQVYRLDAGSNRYVLVVGFDSKDAYLANAQSPGQHARYLEYRELLDAEPDWQDGEIVYTFARR